MTPMIGGRTRVTSPPTTLSRQTAHTAHRAHASDVTDTDHTRGPQDHVLLENHADARHGHWLVCEPLCFWTGGVNVAISTFATLPSIGWRRSSQWIIGPSLILRLSLSIPDFAKLQSTRPG